MERRVPRLAHRVHTDRVRRHSPPRANAAIDRRLEESVLDAAPLSRQALGRRIDALDQEWDIERWLELNAGSLALGGLGLGLAVDRRFLALPAVVLPFLIQHALQGWCPPIALFRRLGVRTRQEIDRERYALKALRGDFDDVAAADGDARKRAEQALRAVWR